MIKSAILLTLAVFATHASAVVLVENQVGRCTIVTGTDDGQSAAHTLHRRVTTRVVRPSGVLRMAARDLADTLHDMGWVGDPRHEIPVVETMTEARTPYRILLGTAAIEEYDLQAEAATLSYPGYIVRTVGNDLLIFGASSKGTANGVFGFLQDELGVRWFGPQEAFRVVPDAGTTGTIAIGSLDRRVEPSYTGRFGISAPLENPQNPWMRRMRMAEPGDGFEPFIEGGHGMHRILRPEDHWETHPAYFQMQGGQRRLHAQVRNTNPCWSNPDVIAITVEAAKRHFRERPLSNAFSLGITDANAFCECDTCRSLQPERTFRGLRVASDMYVHFVNAVARGLRDDFPGRHVTLIAYRDVTAPPLGDIEDNVVASLVLDISEHYDPDYRAQDLALVEAWTEKNITLGLYYYTGLAKLVPAYFPCHLGATLKDLHARGFRTLRSESSPGWPWNGPMHYVDARLWWDITLDVDQLLDDYFKTLFGPAAPHMAAMYNLFEEIHMRPRSGGFLYEHYNLEQFRAYTGEDLEQIRAYIDAAHASIDGLGIGRLRRDHPDGQRVAYVTRGLSVFLDMLEGLVLARSLEREDPANDLLDILESMNRIQRMQVLMQRHERQYRETILSDLTHNNRFLNDTVTPARDHWKQYLATVSANELARLHPQRASLDERLQSRIDARLEVLWRDPFGRATFLIESGLAKLGDNHAPNPGFSEMTGRHPDYPTHLDWSPSAADGWAIWTQNPGHERFSFSSETRHDNVRSAHIHGVDIGCFVGWIPDINPNTQYTIGADVKINAGPDDRSTAVVVLRWLDDNAQWIRGLHTRTDQRTEQRGGWIRMDAIAEPPPNAASAVILLYAENLHHDADVFFDNITLREISE